jgi:hypothetical protein
MVIMPLIAFVFTQSQIWNEKLDFAQSYAILIQGTCPGSAILNLFSGLCNGKPRLA